jgi:uncharacterized membrane protein YbaN (DUF454 family)
MRVILSLLGFASVGFGIAGIFIPVWPSTVFFIVALGLFAKSNPAAERWLIEHPVVGPGLRAWREHGAISRSAKIVASLAILLSIGASIYFVGALWLQIVLATIAVSLILFICSRPEPRIKMPFTDVVKGNDAA